MPGNGHVPFLEGGMVATPSCYSTTVSHGQPFECFMCVLRPLKLDEVIIQTAWLTIGKCSIVAFTLIAATPELYECRLPEFEEFAVGQTGPFEEFRYHDNDLCPVVTSYSLCIKPIEFP